MRPSSRWILAGVAVALAGAVAAVLAPVLVYGRTVRAPAWAAGIRTGKLRSSYCISCHAPAAHDWMASHHHPANTRVDAAHPGAEFHDQELATHSADYRFITAANGAPVIEEHRRDGHNFVHHPAMAIGWSPLRQFVIETRPGNFQASEVAWDPAKHQWFDVFGGEVRNPGDWGHWTGQAMNWNSMCARCHMTVYDKAYDEAHDRHRSTWVEQGIGCVQCHGPMTGHEKRDAAFARSVDVSRDPQRAMQTCAVCHARAEDLTTSAPPGDAFDDHYRMQLMTDPHIYFPDGQIRDEDFEWGSFRHSRMFAAGVTCLDCHNAHTGKTRLSFEDNRLCLQCHSPGNPRHAPVIDPVAHSFHAAGSPGNRCISCHMPTTTYMQRHPRHDHGFIIPDPILTCELGVPNACARCHSDKSTGWIVAAWEKHYGRNPRTTELRTRARIVARAEDGDATAVPELLRLFDTEKVPAWRASPLSLASRFAPDNRDVLSAAKKNHDDPDPLVRAVAIQVLSADASAEKLVHDALNDPVRLVRVNAEQALSKGLPANSSSRRELDAYFDALIETPSTRLRRGQDRFQRGDRAAGVADVRRAIALDPLSAPFPETLGLMLSAGGQPAEAAGQFAKAAELAPNDPVAPYYAALAWADAGDLNRAEKMFRETLQRDPSQGRAWYNLALLLNQTGHVPEALGTLHKAELASPHDPDVPYAAATILARLGRRVDAVAAARRALAIDPHHQPARELLVTLGSTEDFP